jgi:hypothetical protein
MRNRLSWKLAGGAWALLGLAWLVGQGAAPSEPPHIVHDPVGVALRGQPITILTQISATAPIKAVTLHYTLSKDASPFKLVMQATGPATFLGTIPAGLLGNADKVSYYIEATDDRDAAAETPWYMVAIKDSATLLKTPASAVVAAPVAPTAAAATDTDKTSLVGAGLVAGGAAAVIGVALYVANRNGSGSDGGGAVTNVQGTYTGSKTICLSMTGQPNACATTPVSIIIDQNGGVFSDSLIDGRVVSGTLSGNSFTVSGSTSASNLVSELSFSGSVVDSRIVGTVTGTAQSATNSGAYSGSFTAGK